MHRFVLLSILLVGLSRAFPFAPPPASPGGGIREHLRTGERTILRMRDLRIAEQDLHRQLVAGAKGAA